MSDPLDLASDLEANQRESAIASALAIARAHDAEPSANFCELPDCGAVIPQARREAIAGCRFCVECQARIERHPELRRRYL